MVGTKVAQTNEIKKQLRLHEEKEALQRENAMLRMKQEKLENLCRELQRANKNAINDAKQSAIEEANKRDALSQKFEGGIAEITSKLEEHGNERIAQLKENETLREHLHRLTERSTLQEEHYEKAKHTFELEKQLYEARLAEAEEKFKASEAHRAVLASEVEARAARETELLEQLVSYADRFEEFQGMIKQSNEAYATFKKDMAEMNKALRKSEKEKAELEAKTRKSDVAMIQLLEERENATRAHNTLKTQKEKLENLCRALTLKAKMASGDGGKEDGGGGEVNRAEGDNGDDGAAESGENKEGEGDGSA